MTTFFARSIGALTMAASLTFAGAAHAACIDIDHFKEFAAKAGLTIRYAATVEVREAPTPAYIAVNRDGAWVAYFAYGDAVVCVIAAGRRWTEQGKIPPADLRPGG